MGRIPYGKYSKEFRQEAVKLVIEGGLSITEAGRRLSLAPSTLSNWVRAYKKGKLSEVGSTHRQLTEIEIWTNCYIHVNLQKISDIITKNISSRVTP